MKNMSFNIGDRVAVIEDYKIIEGNVTRIYPNLDTPVMTVKFDDGSYDKVAMDEVAKIEEVKEDANDPTLKDEITLTQDRFKDVSAGALAEYVRETEDTETAMTCTVIIAVILKSLFTESSDGVSDEN